LTRLTGLIAVMECSRGCLPAPFPNHLFGSLSRFTLFSSQGILKNKLLQNEGFAAVFLCYVEKVLYYFPATSARNTVLK
ncbi:MAG: hypothetical protein PHR18_06980, partial [Oscillospiraceae bacterium]|nr:hypothetical protein [Oscillospiraceae bacterium]MDD3833627.1 hypothetical protein [Oscillospiraceae bacterium]